MYFLLSFCGGSGQERLPSCGSEPEPASDISNKAPRFEIEVEGLRKNDTRRRAAGIRQLKLKVERNGLACSIAQLRDHITSHGFLFKFDQINVIIGLTRRIVLESYLGHDMDTVTFCSNFAFQASFVFTT
jgi:hypothetical protein